MIAIREFQAGEVVFRENDPADSAYVIERGRVEVSRNIGGKKIHLAYIGPGEPFGEMGMIDEKPRSATVAAVETTVVRELHRDNFVQVLKTNPELGISLLKVLFERLREADATILQIYRSHPELAPSQPLRLPAALPSERGTAVYLEGLTPDARRVLPENPFRIANFPFRIGRRTSDPLTNNDLYIDDREPLQISRHHVAILKYGDRICVSDRGSRLGSLLDGKQVGGAGQPGSIFLAKNEGMLILGDATSRYVFRLSIEQG